MQSYVAGFLFRNNNRRVALVRKNRPDWQRGKFNGVGGKVEPGETEYAAMVREFREETGETVTDWTPVCVLTAGDATVHFFRSFSGDKSDLKSLTDEVVQWWFVENALRNSALVSNLKWLIPMAADTDCPFGEIKSGFSA